MLKPEQDAFGEEIFAHYNGQEAQEIIERDDGYIDVSYGPAMYFSEYPDWPEYYHKAMEQVRGRTLDIGSGAGRISLYLQSQGYPVTAIDNSPKAIEVCRLRGVQDARVCPITQVDTSLGQFESIVMLGNNFGLFGNPRRMRYLDPRIRRYALTAIALFTGFSAIQQTLGFQLQDKLQLDGVATAQYNGAALMVSALFTFVMQVTVMQRVKAPPKVFIRSGLVLLGIGGLVVSAFGNFAVLAVGMAFFGSGLGLAMPAITAGASLAVPPEEQGAAAGVIASCPAVGFVTGPVVGGLIYPFAPSAPALAGAAVFFLTVTLLAATSRG